MNGQHPDVPIIGQTRQIVITDTRVISPNVVELRDNGLGMGDSIAHLRLVDPLKQRAYLVPLVEHQLDTLGSQVSGILTHVNPTDYPGGTHDNEH
jgi:hypothetical protein